MVLVVELCVVGWLCMLLNLIGVDVIIDGELVGWIFVDCFDVVVGDYVFIFWFKGFYDFK